MEAGWKIHERITEIDMNEASKTTGKGKVKVKMEVCVPAYVSRKRGRLCESTPGVWEGRSTLSARKQETAPTKASFLR